MDWNLKINNSWTGGQKKNLQKMLNTFGFTDGAGNKLAEDGVIGPKTAAAIQKLNQYQSEARTPSAETRELQKQLNDFGFKDASGKALKEDGVYGPKTDAVNNDFENNFLDGVTGGRNTYKAVQKGIYPSLPQITQKDVESVITPKPSVKDPMANQKNPDGTWKQVAAPGTWSGSGGTTPNDLKLLEEAKAAQDMTRRINEGRTQFGYQEAGGAQSQATVAPKTNGGVPVPGTGKDWLDMLLGKGKVTVI